MTVAEAVIVKGDRGRESEFLESVRTKGGSGASSQPSAACGLSTGSDAESGSECSEDPNLSFMLAIIIDGPTGFEWFEVKPPKG